MLVAVGFHVDQIGVVKVVAGLSWDDIGVTHIHSVWLFQCFEIATKIKGWICVTFDVDCLLRVLLRLEQPPRRHRITELLHKLAHNDSQLTGNFIFQLWIAFLRRDLLREMHNHPPS
ncbi:hypothetical protein D3C80_1713710 [compost metagenome]